MLETKIKTKMTRALYHSMFIFLSVLLLAVLFVVQPTTDKDMMAFRTELKGQFAQASEELLAGESIAEPFAFVWTTIKDFYSQSADEALALLQPDESLTRFVMMFDSEYLYNEQIAFAPVYVKPATEEALVNIIPMDENELLLDPDFNEDAAYVATGGVVAGESIDFNEQPGAPQVPVVWMTITDSITGEPNCVAIFNGTVNSYPGYCAKEDDIIQVYEN